MAETVYLLCAVTSIICAVLLIRAYLHSRLRLLFWSFLCFLGFALNNGILFFDKVVVPHVDLSLLRHTPAVIGIACLLYGFIWESDDPL